MPVPQEERKRADDEDISKKQVREFAVQILTFGTTDPILDPRSLPPLLAPATSMKMQAIMFTMSVAARMSHR